MSQNDAESDDRGHDCSPGYFRNEKWKRAESVPKEMNEFFGDASVQRAMLLID